MGVAEWFFGIIGSVAFLMAVQPFLQMFINPKIEARFDDTHITDNNHPAKVLRCYVRNLPLNNRLLRCLRLRRPPALSIQAELHVREEGSQRVVYDRIIPAWALRNPSYLPNQADIAPVSQNAYLNIGIKFEGITSLDLFDMDFFDKELPAINKAFDEGGNVAEVLKHPLGIGVFRLILILYGQDVTCSASATLNNQGPKISDAWFS